MIYTNWRAHVDQHRLAHHVCHAHAVSGGRRRARRIAPDRRGRRHGRRHGHRRRAGRRRGTHPSGPQAQRTREALADHCPGGRRQAGSAGEASHEGQVNQGGPAAQAADTAKPAKAAQAGKPAKPGPAAGTAAAPAPASKAAKPVKPAKQPKKGPNKVVEATVPRAVKRAAAAPAVAPAAAPAPAAERPRTKEKLVRDSFTMPRSDFALIVQLKERALGFRHVAKKSELLRAGLHALAALEAPALQALLARLPALKSGRPRKAG
jgi:hypothetical protein